MARSSLLFDLFAASQQVKTLLTRGMADAGLRPDEYAVYSGMFEFGPVSPTQLAAVVGIPPTTLSHYIRQMREVGHLVEQKMPTDGRSRTMSLSAAGLAAHQRANRAFEVAYAAFVARVPNQVLVKAAIETIETAAREALGDLH